MRRFLITLLAVSFSVPALAHHPDRANHPVVPYFDLIHPLGNCLPMSYRRRYNRPTHVGGKIAYYIAPTSQEAMAWHRATHKGYYRNKAPRMVTHYFYPKPWEAIPIGPRTGTSNDGSSGDYDSGYGRSGYGGRESANEPDTGMDPMELPADHGLIE